MRVRKVTWQQRGRVSGARIECKDLTLGGLNGYSGVKCMSRKKTPPSYTEPGGPSIVETHSYRLSPFGPALRTHCYTGCVTSVTNIPAVRGRVQCDLCQLLLNPEQRDNWSGARIVRQQGSPFGTGAQQLGHFGVEFDVATRVAVRVVSRSGEVRGWRWWWRRVCGGR